MNNLRNETDSSALVGKDGIEDYLDHLCTPLVGQVPYAVRQKLRLEAEEHLCALIAEFAEKGLPPQDALDRAMQEHGEPWRIGQAYADEWLRGGASIGAYRLVAPNVMHGLAWFGMVSVPTLLLVEQGCLVRNSIGMEWVGVLAVFAPFVAGGLTGLTAPMQPVRAACCGLLLHILVAFTAGCLLLPELTGLKFAGFQLAFWLPAGCGSAWAVAYFRLSQQRQRFLHRVRSRVA